MIALAWFAGVALLALQSGETKWQELQKLFLAGSPGAYEQLVAGRSAAVPWLVEVLRKDGAGTPQFLAANALGEIAEPACVPPLLEALGAEWFNVRRCAALALGYIGDERARAPLERLAESDPFAWKDARTGEVHHLVREDAREALRLLDEGSDVFLEDASRPPVWSAPAGPVLPWPFDGGLRDQNLWGNYQQPTDAYVHAALDLLQPAGTPVRAVESGTVAFVSTNYPDWTTHHVFVVEPVWGKGEGWCYTHVDPATYAFEVGDEVRAGQVLGSVVDFSVGANDGADHLHLHYVSFEKAADGGFELRSLYDPLSRFAFEDARAPRVHTPFWLVRARTLQPLDRGALSGEVDVLVALSDDAYEGQTCAWMVPVVTIEIRGEGAQPWPKLVLDQRGPLRDERQVEALYLSFDERRPFVRSLPPVPQPFVLKATHTDGDGVIESTDAHRTWNTGELDASGARRFPDGDYVITVRAWDLAGNLGVGEMAVTVRNGAGVR